MADSTNGGAQAPKVGTGNTPAAQQKPVAQQVRASADPSKTADQARAESESKQKSGAGEESSTPASEAPFTTVDGAQTDRPKARQEDVVAAVTGGGGPPLSDEITQGGTDGPPGQVTADSESQRADNIARLRQHYTHSRQALTEEKLNLMSRPEILAVATDRGYDFQTTGGKRTIIGRFLAAQRKDEDNELHDVEDVAPEALGNTSRGKSDVQLASDQPQTERLADDRPSGFAKRGANGALVQPPAPVNKDVQ